MTSTYRLTWFTVVFIALFITSLLAMRSASAATSAECVQVFYDKTQVGQMYAQAVQNLLGHFPSYQQIVAPVSEYKAGQLDECKASLYIGSNFNEAIPQAFVSDYQRTSKNVLWMGYGIWKLESTLEEALGHRYVRLTELDRKNLDEKRQPTFYKDILYKGEVFPKYAGVAQGEFHAAFEMTLLEPLQDARGEGAVVLASAKHNGTGHVAPYAVRKGNRFFLADIPLTFIHEADRYLVFADLLFDLLDEKPRHVGKRPAIWRIEDVTPCTPIEELEQILAISKEFKIPFQVALVPIFANPLRVESGCDGSPLVRMDQAREFMAVIRRMKDAGATFIWHGVTHQLERKQNPYNGLSGDDYEFWLYPENRPVAGDSVPWLAERLDIGWEVLDKASLSPQIWEVPHYQASALDYYFFARTFAWNIGRVMYYSHTATGVPRNNQPLLWYEKTGLAGSEARKKYFADMKVSMPEKPISYGQLFPYEIYGDVYGQRLLPENMNYPEDYAGKAIPDMIAMVKRNKVLRDAWASFFFHPYNLSETGPEPLRQLLRAMVEEGYEFIRAEQFIQDKKHILRPDPIVR